MRNVNRIGIRREDKSRWERRVPLVPDQVQRLIQTHAIEFCVQTSPTRAFPDDAYRQAGARVVDDLADCGLIMGVKEIPAERLEPDKTYIYLSHVIKGQPSNMPMLQRLMELGCQLIDYEMITDQAGRRVVSFGRHAGLAGMIDTLWALGRRLEHEGIANPFEPVRPAHRYDDLEHARSDIVAAGERIRREGLPEQVRPMVCGFTGYGQVSQGAQEIFDLLPVQEVSAAELDSIAPSANEVYKVVFRKEHLFERIDSSAPFQLQEYRDQPERYQSGFLRYLPHLTVLVNCIYWEPKYPRLVTQEQFGELYGAKTAPRLRVIGDITCDVDGSLACTVRATEPDNPIYVYDPVTGQADDGVAGRGPVVLAVDFLPCELPVDASKHFGASLGPFVPALAGADFGADLADSGLPPELQRATIVYQGRLTDPYRYIGEYLE